VGDPKKRPWISEKYTDCEESYPTRSAVDEPTLVKLNYKILKEKESSSKWYSVN
jgi:hypothetical protein